MSIITKQPSEFHNQIPNPSSTIKVLPVRQQELVQDNSYQKHPGDSSLSNTVCSKSSGIKLCENLLKNEDLFGNDSLDKKACENLSESINKHDGSLNANVTCERIQNDERIFDKNESSLSGNNTETPLIDKSSLKIDSGKYISLESTPEVTAAVKKQDGSVPNVSQNFNTILGWNSPYSNSCVKQEFVSAENESIKDCLQLDKQSTEVSEKGTNVCDLKQEIEPLVVSKCPNNNIETTNRQFDQLSDVLKTQDDGWHGRKNSFTLLQGKELDTDDSFRYEVSHTKPSEFTSLISSQRETILKLRREERYSVEKTSESKSKQENQMKTIRPLDFREEKKLNMTNDSKSKTSSEKNRHKKLKKKLIDYSGINDLFSEPLKVKSIFSGRNEKRERKLPSKFIYLSKMEKYLSHGPKIKHKKKNKPKYEQADELTTKIKTEKGENIKECVKADSVKEVTKIKILTMKDENTEVLKKHIKFEQPEQLDSSFSGSKSPSKVSTSPFRKSLLRDDSFHKHCRRRYYRLKQSNWNSSSRRALHLLKRKYNSIKLLFDKEPVICLERLNLRDPHLQSVMETFDDESDTKCDSMTGYSPWISQVKTESESLVEGTKMHKTLIQEHCFNKSYETKNLVDPRVMSLSKTLQTANNGKVGLEKIFKNYNSKPMKSKKKVNDSKSHSNSIKKKGKPDWSKWKEKLKEASNRMVDKKKGSLNIGKNINSFPSSFINNSPPSILHFRIPLKSSNKVKTEDNKTGGSNGISDTVNTVQSENNQSEVLEKDIKTPKINKNEAESNLFKEIDEELTLEEFETDKAITYSINGYSIEISRDSPIDIKTIDSKTSVESECFDEEEMNKILYGDNLGDVSLDCDTRNIQEHFNDTDAGLTVTSDIIPNLFAQDEFFQTDKDDFANEIDKSPPVLERSEYSIAKIDVESENNYIVQVNEEKQDPENTEESLREDAECSDSENETFFIDEKGDMKREKLMTVNKDDVNTESESEVYDDEKVDKSPGSILSFDELSDENLIIQDDNQTMSDSDVENETFDSSSIVIENICSLRESTHGSMEHLHEKQDSCRKDADYADDTKVCHIPFIENKNLIQNVTNENESVTSIDKSTFPQLQDQSNETKGRMNLYSGLKNKLDKKCSETNVTYSVSVRDSMSKDTDFQSETISNKKSVNDYSVFAIRKPEELQAEEDIETTQSSKTNDICNRGNEKAPEKSAAAVMEDLEKMWREMTSKTEIENVPLKRPPKVDRADFADSITHLNEKVCNIANSIVFRKCTSKERTTLETVKKAFDTQLDSGKAMSGMETFIDKDDESQIDNGYSLKTKEFDSKTKTVGGKSDDSIKDLKKHKTIESKIRKAKGEYTPTTSINFDTDNSENRYHEKSVVDLLKTSEEVVEVSEMEYRTKDSKMPSLKRNNTEDAATEEFEKSNTEQTKQRKRKSSSDIQTSVENPHTPTEDSMEQTDERIMCDFPNHNWLFNKYNIGDVKPEKEVVKDTKGKKHKKEDKDVNKHSREAKYRRKSCHSTANILPTQRKQSGSKNDNIPESHNLHKEGIKIKWNKVSKRSSLCDKVNFEEKLDLHCQTAEDINTDKDVNMSKSFGQLNDELSSNSPSIKNNFPSMYTQSINTTAGTLFSHTIKMNNTDMEINHNSGINTMKCKDLQETFTAPAKHRKSSGEVLVEEMKDSMASTALTESGSVRDNESLERKIFGEFSDEEEDDDDEKLQIDETMCIEDTPDAENLSMHVDETVLDEPTSSRLDDSSCIKKVAISDETSLNETEATTITSVNKTIDPTPVLVSPSTSTNCEVKPDVSPSTDQTLSAPDIIHTEVVSLKNSGLLDSNKPECGSISFKPRTKPPVQLVHPQVHKPPTGKVKLETVAAYDISTHVPIHTVENKEESANVSLAGEVDRDQGDSGVTLGQVSKADQIRSNLIPSVTFASNIQLSSPSLPVSVLSTLAQHSSGCITVTSTSSSSFGNGMVVPIQPFVQNIPNTLQPGYVQNMPQLQSNIVPIQSSSIKPLCQQSSPVHVQNQLIPISIYQAGNQTIISNYTYTNTGSELMPSNQSANIIQAQPVNFSMNQTQMNTSPVQIPVCRPVNSGPPPLLILPKASNLSTFNQQRNQVFQAQKANTSLKKLKMSPKYQNNNIEEKDKTEDKVFKQEKEKSSLSEEHFNDIFSKNDTSSNLGKEGSPSHKVENIEEEVDDEIKKQMEELDKEIKRKEQEQEEMRRKKIELLEKMKQAKSNSKLKEVETNVKNEDNCEKEKSVTVNTDETDKEVDDYTDSKSEDEQKELQNMNLEIEEDKKITCKDIVNSDIVEEGDDDVFDSDTPIDLSSALKSNRINNFSKENLSLTVSDGIISIKETNNIENSLSSVVCGKEVKDNLSTFEKSENELECLDNENEAGADNYAENKCDDINYIEDIGLVNPFTGEYEINEDVECVEYLDLSTSSASKADDTTKNVESEKFDDSKIGESVESEEISENKCSHSNLKLTEKKETTEKVSDETSKDKSSEELATVSSIPITTCTDSICNTSIIETIDQTSSNLIQSPVTLTSAVSLINSTIVSTTTVPSSAVEKSSGCNVSSTSNSLSSSISGIVSVTSKDSIANNWNNIVETPLNLEKVKVSSVERSPASSDKVLHGYNKNLSDAFACTEDRPQPKRSEALQENNITPLIQHMNKRSLPLEREAQMIEIHSNTASTVPQNVLPSSEKPPRGRISFFRRLMQKQDQQILAQANNSDSENVRGISHRQNIGRNSDIRQSRGLAQRRGREKYMEVKPAHYRSPPRKIHKGEKPPPAHKQHPTSRETMKRMCKTASIHTHVAYRTSPFLRNKHPNFLSPKEILKPFPRLWEKKSPKPAHSKRPFGIAGHLIVQSSRKYRKQEASGEWTPSPRFYSLPNTPTSTDTTPPRATSVDFQGRSSPLHSPSDTQANAPSTSVLSSGVSSASSNKTPDHHGAQVGLPSPIRAHCRPKSLMSSNQFYETSVLRPPALLRNSKPEVEAPEPDVVEVIDLTSDLPQMSSSELPSRPVESLISKERAIQKELNHAVSKRQRLDNSEPPATEKINLAGRQAAARLQQQLGQINARQRLMPPPPYTGRQRMPVLVQVPRQPVLEQYPRMQKTRRMDPQFDEKRKLLAQNTDIPRFQTPPEMIQVGPQIRPHIWPSHYVVPNQEMSPGSEHMPQRPIYPVRGPLQTSDGSNMDYAGNPRMPHPNESNLNSIPQQGYPIRAQSMPYTTAQNQTQIHQLLQQPHGSSQIIQRRGNISPQVIQRERMETSPQIMQRGEISPQIMQRGEISPQIMQRGEISPKIMQRGEISPQIIQRGAISPQSIQRGNISPQRMQRGEISPQIMQRGDISPQIMQRGATSPQIIQRGITSPQMNKSISPHILQRGISNQMPQNPSSNPQLMHTPNSQMMPTGELSQKAMYAAGSVSQMMHGINPQVMNAAGPLQSQSSVNSFQRSPIASDNQMHGVPTVPPTLTQEERFQKMKQIRAQHIRTQQIQNRTAQVVGFEQGTRMPDVRPQHPIMEQHTPVVHPQQMISSQQVNIPQQMIGSQPVNVPQQMSGSQPVNVPQQMAGPQQMIMQQHAFNMGLQPQHVRPNGPHVPASTYSQQMAVLEPQIQQSHNPHQSQHGADTVNKAPNVYMMPTSPPQQTNFQQNGIQNNINTLPKNNLLQRSSVYNSNQNVHVLQSKTTPNVMNMSTQNKQDQGRGMPSNVVYMSQSQQVPGQGENRSYLPGNITQLPGSQFVQGHGVGRMQHVFQQSKPGQGQYQNSNWRGQNTEQIQTSNISKNGQMAMPQRQRYPAPGVNNGNQTVSVIMPNSQTSVAMTATQLITQSAIPLNLAISQINQPAAANTQAFPVRSHDQKEGQGESRVVEELPHLQQVHGECFMCGKYSLYLCSSCKKIWYCSPECQLTHWQTHADECEGQTG